MDLWHTLSFLSVFQDFTVFKLRVLRQRVGCRICIEQPAWQLSINKTFWIGDVVAIAAILSAIDIHPNVFPVSSYVTHVIFLLIQKTDNLWNLFIQEVVPKLRAISQRCMMNHIERQLVAVSKLQFTFLRIRVVDFFIQFLDSLKSATYRV